MDRTLTLLLAPLLFAIVALGVAGRVFVSSTMPEAGMWQEMLGFYLQVANGPADPVESWQPFRPELIARFFYWVDFQYFHARGTFLQVVSSLLIALVGLALGGAVGGLNRGKAPVTFSIVAGSFLTAWLFLWSAEEHRAWWQHSQYLPSILLPFLSLLAFSAAAGGTRAAPLWFALSCVLGAASATAHVSGLAAFPLLLIAAALFRSPVWQVFTLGLLGIATLGWVGWHILDPASAVSGPMLLWPADPLATLGLFVRYLGQPFYGLLGGGLVAGAASWLAGLIFLLATMRTCFVTFRLRRDDRLRVVLALMILFAWCLAVSWNSSDAFAGCISPSYDMPVLMAWAFLFAYYAPAVCGILSKPSPSRTASIAMLATIAAGLAAHQAFVATKYASLTIDQKVTVLAIELGVADPLYLSEVDNSLPSALRLGRNAARLDWLVFGKSPYNSLERRIGTREPAAKASECPGSIDSISTIPESDQFLRVSGWQFNTEIGKAPDIVTFLDGRDVVVGIAFAGVARPDLESAISPTAALAGFAGYVRTSALEEPISVHGVSAQCVTIWSATKAPV